MSIKRALLKSLERRTLRFAVRYDTQIMALCNRTRQFCSDSTKEDGRSRPPSELSEHIQSCLSTEEGPLDVGFNISFLGTGGGMPSKERMTSSTLLRLGGLAFLFDTGEGLQRQLMFTRSSIRDITKIFITHMHGDHLFGLPSLLLALQQSGRHRNNGEVEIYGPPGIFNYIAATLSLARVHFGFITVTVYELVGGKADQSNNSQGKRSRKRNILYSQYPELANRRLIRREIQPNSDGVWVIQSPVELTKNEITEASQKGHHLPNQSNSGPRKKLQIMAAEVGHMVHVQTFGFTVQEQEPLRNIDPKKATDLGVRPGPKYKLLKNGFSVMSDDGTREVQPEEVLMDATRKARKFALLGDNCRVSEEMLRLCQDTDVLVHEATLEGDMKTEALERGHATAEMAGLVARDVNASVLVLNHISPKFNEEEDFKKLVDEASLANGGVSHVIASYDFLELLVPQNGFERKGGNEQ